MITYHDLYEALRKERYSDSLQLLPKKFIEDVSEYLKNKKEFSNKQEDLFSDLAIKNKKSCIRNYSNADNSPQCPKVDILPVSKSRLLLVYQWTMNN